MDLDYTRPMRRLAVFVLIALGSVACGAAIRWEKAGASEAERQKDETECTSLASREGTAPTARDAAASATTPVGYQRTRVEPYNPTVFDECMGTRGYQRVSPRPPA
jgi:hypothetical protein